MYTLWGPMNSATKLFMLRLCRSASCRVGPRPSGIGLTGPAKVPLLRRACSQAACCGIGGIAPEALQRTAGGGPDCSYGLPRLRGPHTKGP